MNNNASSQVQGKETRTRQGVLSFELAIITIVVVVGCITGFAMFRDAVAYDCKEMANAIQTIDTRYEAGPYGSYTVTRANTTTTISAP